MLTQSRHVSAGGVKSSGRSGRNLKLRSARRSLLPAVAASSASPEHFKPAASPRTTNEASSQPLRSSTRAAAATAPTKSGASSATFKRGHDWEVHKFGGTCVGSSERIRNVAKEMMSIEASDACERMVMVVSAMGTPGDGSPKVTDLLLNALAKAESRDQTYVDDLKALEKKHEDTAGDLLGSDSDEYKDFIGKLREDVVNIESTLKAISIAGTSTETFSDIIVGHGELWTAQMMALTIKKLGGQAHFLDARQILTINPSGSNTNVMYEVSNERLDAWFEERDGAPGIVVATGFIARKPNGVPSTLKRNGSDYSATIFGALFESRMITIWTDVDGVYSADPRKVREAVCLPALSYNEAWELSYFGANVLHPATTLPAMKYNIPVVLRNFFNLDAPGTVISDAKDLLRPGDSMGRSYDEETFPDAADRAQVKGFATIDDVSIINVEGTGLIGVPGTAAMLFDAVRDAKVNVIMISQASSEHSLCFAVKAAEADAAKKAVEDCFKEHIAKGRVEGVEVVENCTILAAVGQEMRARHGTLATLFNALATASVNVVAVAQGSSEYNLTVVVKSDDSVRALRAAHARFFLSETPLAVGLVGPGLIGKVLLRQINEQKEKLLDEFNIDLRVVAIAGSSKMMLSTGDIGINLDTWEDEYANNAEPIDMDAFANHLRNNSDGIPNSVVVDCTASDEVSDFYVKWLQTGIHIVTPNKKVNSGPLSRYNKVRRLQRESYTHYLCEGTVGAGLPIITTLRGLVETGDRIQKVEGIFSGTLSYIFNTWTTDMKFSDVVKQARDNGYTEPDPREDLNGTDVARKVVTLAREAGMMIELDDVPIESLVPEPLRDPSISVDDFMAKLPDYDDEMAAKLAEAEAAGEKLRFVGVADVSNGKASVALGKYPAGHPFTTLQGSDNIIEFQTSRYTQGGSLIVRGPGAGAEVTAAGVFADLLKLTQYLGAPS